MYFTAPSNLHLTDLTLLILTILTIYSQNYALFLFTLQNTFDFLLALCQ